MCAGCGGRFAKAALVRFTVIESGASRELVLDLAVPGERRDISSRGRGGYVCPNPDCLEKALKRKALLRRLKATAESADLREVFLRLVKAANQ